MSETDSPVSAVFDAQRNAVEGTHDVVARSVEMQQNLNDWMLDAVDPARDVTERSNDLVRTGFEHLVVEVLLHLDAAGDDVVGPFDGTTLGVEHCTDRGVVLAHCT